MSTGSNDVFSTLTDVSPVVPGSSATYEAKQMEGTFASAKVVGLNSGDDWLKLTYDCAEDIRW